MNSMSPSLFSHNLRPTTLTASACSSKPELAGKNGNTNNIVSFLVRAWPVVGIPRMSFSIQAKKRSSEPESVPKKNIVEEVDMDDDEDYEDDDDFQDEEFLDDDELLEDEYEDDDADAELNLGDGAAGGGIKLAGTTWDKEALAIAEDVSFSLGDLKIYAFKTLVNNFIQVRIEKLSNKSGSPSMTDIEAFSSAYRERLNEAELAGRIPENISFEVSSPGVERVVGIPQDLDRFKDRPMYVKYVCDEPSTSSPAESDGIFRLVSFDLDTRCCTWGIADVKVNREKAGKGRPLNKKQRDWRLNTSFESLLLVMEFVCSLLDRFLHFNITDGNIDILPILKRIIQSYIPVWVYSGDQDSTVPLLGTRTLVRQLATDLGFKATVPYGAWFHEGRLEVGYPNMVICSEGCCSEGRIQVGGRSIHVQASLV